GIQAAIGATVARHDAVGLQSAIGGMWTTGHMRGVQIGAGVAFAERLTGSQLSTVNVVGSGRGAQLGLVNVSKGELAGVQIGLVNYADEADASIGLVPITKKGGVWVDLWTSDVQLLHFGLKFRARKTYTLLT